MRFQHRATTLLLLVAMAICSACGASQRERTIKTTLVAVNAARDGFVAWDGAHQTAIVAQATTREDGTAKLSEYRTAREPVSKALVIAYQTIAIAAIDDKTSLASMIDAAIRVRDLIAHLTGSSQ